MLLGMTPASLNDVPMRHLEDARRITRGDLKRMLDQGERGLVVLVESASLPKVKRGHVHVLPGPINLDSVRNMVEAP